jgi:hypothetical protein
VFAPLLFFAPLASARRRMWILKEETLKTLGQKIQNASTSDPGALAALADTYKRTQEANVWPFTWTTLSSFIASLGIPLLVTLASELVARLIKG